MAKYLMRDLTASLRYLPYGLIAGVGAVILLHLLNRGRVKRQKKPISMMSGVCYLMYLAIVIAITFLSRESGSRNGIDLELFSTWGINERNNAYVIENILLFIPYGLLSAWVFPTMRNIFTGTLIGLVTSMGIEYLQMMTGRGYFQIDDIVTNTLGAMIGYLLFACILLLGKLYRKAVKAL